MPESNGEYSIFQNYNKAISYLLSKHASKYFQVIFNNGIDFHY